MWALYHMARADERFGEWHEAEEHKCNAVIAAGAVPDVVALPRSRHAEVQSMAAHALALLAGKRDLLAAGALPQLLALLNTENCWVRCEVHLVLTSFAWQLELGQCHWAAFVEALPALVTL